jgi:hypothetical protein
MDSTTISSKQPWSFSRVDLCRRVWISKGKFGFYVLELYLTLPKHINVKERNKVLAVIK